MPIITLDQYARVSQALNVLRIPQADVFAAEHITAEQWEGVCVEIEEEIAAALEVEDHPLLEQYSEAAARARRWLGRPVPPLDRDPRAWVGFLRAFNQAADREQFLAELSLHMADFLNLNAMWSERLPSLIREDPTVLQAPLGIPQLDLKPQAYPHPSDPIGPVSDTAYPRAEGPEPEPEGSPAESPPVFAPLPLLEKD